MVQARGTSKFVARCHVPVNSDLPCLELLERLVLLMALGLLGARVYIYHDDGGFFIRIGILRMQEASKGAYPSG